MQEGFGWTNGVILDLLLTYGAQLSYRPEDMYTDCKCCHPALPEIPCKLQ